MADRKYLRNEDFFNEDRDGANIFHITKRPVNNIGRIFDVRAEGDMLVVEGRMSDPATLLENDPVYSDTWQKREFAQLGMEPDTLLKAEAQERFALSYDEIRATKRTIGTMTTVAFVFDADKVKSDNERVKIAVVQRTSTGPDGTPNMGALSRFGGGATGGTQGKGVHGAQNLGCQTYREFFEEFHPYLRSEGGALTPVDIVPQGYELDGLKGEFMRSVMTDRLNLSARIEEEIISNASQVSSERETYAASPLSIPGLTKPVIQIIDGQEVLHPALTTFDAQATNGNMDFNTDVILAVRVQGVSPDDFVLFDGETDQKTARLLNRIIFFGNPDELQHSVEGEILKLHERSDMSKVTAYSPAFRPILRNSEKLVRAALNYS